MLGAIFPLLTVLAAARADEPSPAGPATERAAAAAEPTTAGPTDAARALAAEALLEEADRLAAEGRAFDAQLLLQVVVSSFPETPSAESARARLVEAEQERLARPVPAPMLPKPTAKKGQREPDLSDGGAFLLRSQAAMGVVLMGGLVPASLGVQSVPAYVLLGFAGLGGGIGGAVAVNRRVELTRGQAQTVLSGEAVGLGNAGLLMVMIQPRSGDGAVASALTAGLLAGGVGGGLVAKNRSPHAADVAMAGSAASWGVETALLSWLWAEPVTDVTGPAARVLIGLDGGLLVGALASNKLQLSTAEVQILNVGWFGGTVVGGGIVLLAADAGHIGPAAAAVVTLGSVAGLGLAAAVVDHRRESDHTSHTWTLHSQPTVLADSAGDLVPGAALHLRW